MRENLLTDRQTERERDRQTDRQHFFYQDKSAGDTSCYYHILSQDAFVFIQKTTNINTCILKGSSKTYISCSLEKDTNRGGGGGGL